MKSNSTLWVKIILLCSAASAQTGHAQTPVTAIFDHAINATTATSYTGTGATGNAPSGFTGDTYIYHFGTNVATTGNDHVVDSFTALGLNYHYMATTMAVQFRRVNNTSVTGLRKSMWFSQDGGATINPGDIAPLYPDYDDSLERVFTGRFLDVGIDNVFQNAITTNNNNIERMDVLFPGGVGATNNTKAGFVVFDRGVDPTHDPFYIAAVKSLDASGNPSAYYNAVEAQATDYGNDVGSLLNYLILRQNPTDPGLLMMDNTASQYRDGVFFRFTDLGVPNNTTIYGYSLFSTDVLVTPATNLVNYTNATNFPTTTDLSNGGLDPVAITGLWTTNASYIILAEWLETFQAALTNNQVMLNWQLAAGVNLKELVVERSPDGVSYSPILQIPAPAYAPQTTIDEHPLPGANYYRLKLMNNEGAVVAYSAVCPVNVPETVPVSANIYPNPVQNKQFALDALGLSNDTYDLRFFDMSGRLVFSQELSGAPVFKQTINLPGSLAGGMYILRLADKYGNKVLVRTIVLE